MIFFINSFFNLDYLSKIIYPNKSNILIKSYKFKILQKYPKTKIKNISSETKKIKKI